MRRYMLTGVLPVVGVAALTLVVGSSVFASEDAKEKMISPSVEMKKERIEKPSFVPQEDMAVRELTNEFERSMSVPDSRSEVVMPYRRPLCGPWKNAIHHYACPSGYDYF